MIAEGRVTVNGKKVFELGQKVKSTDRVVVDGKPIKVETRFYYIAFNKPKDVLTSMSDPDGRPCVGDFFEDFPARLFPVGRLDWDSEGLLLMTNDGDFAQKVAHPKEEIPKTYQVKIDDKIETTKMEKLLNGVSIQGGGRVKAKSLRKIRKGSANKDWLEIIITEGKNRQIRKMFEKVGHDVVKLQRTAIGMLDVGKLDRGQFKELTPRQIEKVFETRNDAKTKRKKATNKTSIKRLKATESSTMKPKKKKASKKSSSALKTKSKASSKARTTKKKKKLGFIRD